MPGFPIPPTPAQHFVKPQPKGGSVSANVPGSPGTGGSSGGSDWQHLMVRGAEFIIGVVLVWVGIQAIVVKSKPTQTIIQTTGTIAKVVK